MPMSLSCTDVQCARATEEQHELKKQPEVFPNEECLINIIKGFSITTDLPWHLIDEVYIPINCGDEFHWVLVDVVLKERPSEFMTRYHEGDIPGHRLGYKSWPKYLP
ncbi:hypothetical protein BC332_12099 [Capsicum chinense]|nr:hypothetical protein BC332_12099 [Capsicum chinense]